MEKTAMEKALELLDLEVDEVFKVTEEIPNSDQDAKYFIASNGDVFKTTAVGEKAGPKPEFANFGLGALLAAPQAIIKLPDEENVEERVMLSVTKVGDHVKLSTNCSGNELIACVAEVIAESIKQIESDRHEQDKMLFSVLSKVALACKVAIVTN